MRSPNDSDWSSPVAPGSGSHIRRASSFSMGAVYDSSLSPSVLGLVQPSSDIVTPLESQWLLTIFRMGFDTVFGSWMGRFGCPFV